MEILNLNKKKKITWKDRLEALDVGETLNIDVAHGNAVRARISTLKNLYKWDYAFVTERKTQKGVDFIEIKRVK